MAVLRGIVLGAANVLVIAIGMGVTAHDSAVISLVIVFGCIPGLVAGAVLGGVARWTDTRSPWLRATLLAVPGMGVVLFLAAAFDMYDFFLVACIPTLIAALILERWTRRAPAPPVPVATVIPAGM
jgi:ABC-type dipeptide/oligopeptide/nickel transport system permease subunit